MDIEAFCNEVETIVEEQYDFEDGGDLCYNLIEMGAIDIGQGTLEAARIVAMHIGQA